MSGVKKWKPEPKGDCNYGGEKINIQIKYSRHIETRLALRKIEYDLPRRIYENPEEELRLLRANALAMTPLLLFVIASRRRSNLNIEIPIHRFTDTETGHTIAVMNMANKGI